METRPNLLVINNFHPPTITKLDRLYQTHHLWKLDGEHQQTLISELAGLCTAAATGSWAFNETAYKLDSLKLIAAFGVGVDGIDLNLTRENQIRVTNTPNVLNDDVADIALALILATSRNIINADRYVRSKQWEKGPMHYDSGLAGKTLGIIGLGRIGQAVVERALPFKLKIAYHNRNNKKLSYEYFSTVTELAKHSDILLSILPGGKETKGIVDAEVLKSLGPKGIFINIGRGTSVNENDLINSLSQETIAAAGLDVYESEPKVPKALRELDNVVLLPHIGSATLQTRAAMGNLLLENLNAFFSKKSLISEVL